MSAKYKTVIHISSCVQKPLERTGSDPLVYGAAKLRRDSSPSSSKHVSLHITYIALYIPSCVWKISHRMQCNHNILRPYRKNAQHDIILAMHVTCSSSFSQLGNFIQPVCRDHYDKHSGPVCMALSQLGVNSSNNEQIAATKLIQTHKSYLHLIPGITVLPPLTQHQLQRHHLPPPSPSFLPPPKIEQTRLLCLHLQ